MMIDDEDEEEEEEEEIEEVGRRWWWWRRLRISEYDSDDNSNISVTSLCFLKTFSELG